MVADLYENIDKILGDGEHRFFGNGYRCVQSIIKNLAFGANGLGGLNGRVSVRYPDDWSKKGMSFDARMGEKGEP
ncbi:MAG: AvrD family protein [Acidiferrobacter sp.]